MPILDMVPGGKITSSPGSRKSPTTGASKYHMGTDIAAPVGSPVINQASGRVVFMGNATGFGPNTILIQHELPNNTYGQVFIGHLGEINKDLRVGDYIPKGFVIGYVGNEGLSTGPHAHIEAESCHWKP